MNQEELEQRLQAQIETIDEAIAKIRQNELLDIGFMDKEVAGICQQIIHSDEDAIKALEAKMIEMITRLDELAVELKQYQDRVNPEGV